MFPQLNGELLFRPYSCNEVLVLDDHNNVQVRTRDAESSGKASIRKDLCFSPNEPDNGLDPLQHRGCFLLVRLLDFSFQSLHQVADLSVQTLQHGGFLSAKVLVPTVDPRDLLRLHRIFSSIAFVVSFISCSYWSSSSHHKALHLEGMLLKQHLLLVLIRVESMARWTRRVARVTISVSRT